MGAIDTFDGCIPLGPWGNDSLGKTWVYMPQGFIENITIVHGRVIDSIKFYTKCSPDKAEWSVFGGSGGNKTSMICLDYPNEYLVSISGTCGSYKGSFVVSSLCFGTNRTGYGPYGLGGGTTFKFDAKNGVIVGFHGNADNFLNAVGIYVMPESLASAWHEDNSNSELSFSVSRIATTMSREVGPWGGLGGKPWDDGVFSTVKQVRVHVGESLKVIHAIQFVYVTRDGKYFISPFHGETSGNRDEMVYLDGTDEYFTGISGFYGLVEGYDGLAITSITFYTNTRTYGPYGKESGKGFRYFASTGCPGKIVGFHGRNDGFLTAIGVHMEYF